MRIRPTAAAALIAAAVSIMPLAAPAQAENQQPDEMISEGASLIINAIELMLQAIPTYEAPEVLPNGDIIIRRVDPNRKKAPEEDLEAPGQKL